MSTAANDTLYDDGSLAAMIDGAVVELQQCQPIRKAQKVIYITSARSAFRRRQIERRHKQP